jgi:opacity protein-like surface antigen
MKKILLMAAIAVAVMGISNAQENAVKVNPLAILGGTDLVSYEKALNDNSSVVLSGAIAGYKIGSFKYSFFGAGAQYRYYFEEVIRGWYGAGSLAYQNGKVESEDTFGGGESDEISFGAISAGVKGGYQWSWDSGFTLDLNLGINYVNFGYDDTDNSSFTALEGSGILPQFGFGLGYAW